MPDQARVQCPGMESENIRKDVAGPDWEISFAMQHETTEQVLGCPVRSSVGSALGGAGHFKMWRPRPSPISFRGMIALMPKDLPGLVQREDPGWSIRHRKNAPAWTRAWPTAQDRHRGRPPVFAPSAAARRQRSKHPARGLLTVLRIRVHDPACTNVLPPTNISSNPRKRVRATRGQDRGRNDPQRGRLRGMAQVSKEQNGEILAPHHTSTMQGRRRVFGSLQYLRKLSPQDVKRETSKLGGTAAFG